MLESIDNRLKVLASQRPATSDQISALKGIYLLIPDEYVALVQEATEIELQYQNGQYLRIWGPDGCVDMDEGYGISKRIDGAMPIGDDGGGRVVFYANGKNGFGLYCVGYGDLDMEDAVFVSPSLFALLERAVGLEVL